MRPIRQGGCATPLMVALMAVAVALAHLSGLAASQDDLYRANDINSLEDDQKDIKSDQPIFDLLMPRNVTALAGQTAFLSCIVHNLGNYSVSWIRHRDLHILTVGPYTFTSDKRFQSTHHKKFKEWVLDVKRAQHADSGMYECQVSTQPITSYSVYLNVVVPTATISEGPELRVEKGSTINLTCSIRFSPKPPDYVTWYHDEEIILEKRPPIGVSVVNVTGEVPTSRLLVYDADFPDSGTYTCRSSNADETSVNVHVINGETPAAMQKGSAHISKGSRFANLCCSVVLLLLMKFMEHYIELLR